MIYFTQVQVVEKWGEFRLVSKAMLDMLAILNAKAKHG